MSRDHVSEPFTGEVKVSSKLKLVFKFVVNSNWITSDAFKAETDEHGNLNNYVDADELTAVEEFVEVPADPTEKESESVVLEDAAPVEVIPDAIPEMAGKKAEIPVEATPIKAASDDHEDELFTRVSNAGSSYASVSVNSSDYEHVSQDSDASNRNAPEEITPIHTAEDKSNKATAPQLSDSEVTTIGPSSRNNSFTGGLNQSEGTHVNKTSTILRDLEKNKRREGLMGRLRGLFRS